MNWVKSTVLSSWWRVIAGVGLAVLYGFAATATNPIPPIIFRLGPFQVRWYGVLIMIGVGLGAFWASRLAVRRYFVTRRSRTGVSADAYWATRPARKNGLNPEHAWGALILAVLFGILGARLYHVFSTPAGCPPDATFPCGWPYYQHHFLDAFALWKTGGFQGLGIYGAVVGGIVGVAAYALVNHLKPLVWLDLGAPGLAFGQFVGRWGNFINQELYGPPTGSTWFGIRINPNLPHQELPPGTDYSTRFHPTFLYESAWCLLVFLVLYNVHARLASPTRRTLRDGDILLGYIILYPLGRFFIEFFRPDAWKIGGLAAAQWIAIGCVVGGLAVLVLRHLFWKRPEAGIAAS